MSNTPGQEKTWPEAQPEAPANSYKKPIQNSKQQPQKWGGRFSARPIFGASAACGASVVVLNFVSVFCKGLQELLAQLFFGLDFFGLFPSTFFFDFFPPKKRFFGQWIIEKAFVWSTDHQKCIFSQIGFPPTDFFPNRFFPNRKIKKAATLEKRFWGTDLGNPHLEEFTFGKTIIGKWPWPWLMLPIDIWG